ncbi:MAG TPA: hypothetical protein VM537_00960 [Anaerolineae bacterium]|nr:hypothetical protein [Anaerolineae bacterium]
MDKVRIGFVGVGSMGLVIVVVAFYVMYQKLNLPPPTVASEMRDQRSDQYEAQQSKFDRATQPPSEDSAEVPESETPEDGE